MAPRRSSPVRRGPWALALGLLTCACARGPVAQGGREGQDLKELSQRTGVDQVARRDAPIALTAVDGADLPLRVLHVRAALDQPLAFTELELLFDNPEGRALEGHLALALPPGARVTRFAALREGEWREAEVVPRRAAFQQLGLGQQPPEPQLVGAPEGERFVARVEAIAAQGPTRLLVAYVQELRGRSEPFRVPLAGLGPLRDLAVSLRARGRLVVGGDPEFERVGVSGEYAHFSDFSPGADLVVQSQGDRELGLRQDNMVVARISPVSHDHPDLPASVALLFDTSASQALAWDAHVDRLGQLIGELGARVLEDIPLRVICFDQGVEVAYSGPIRGFGAAALAAIRARRPLGASNLAGALRFAAGVGERPPSRLILMTDGLATAGATAEPALLAEADRLRDAGVDRLDVVVAGGVADPALLRTFSALARLSPEQPGLVLRGGLSPRSIAHRLTRSVVDNIEVSVPGSEWVYPAQIDGVQAGDDVLVYADVAADLEGQAPGRLDLELKGPEVEPRRAVKLAPAPSPLLAEAWAGARAAWLIDEARGCAPRSAENCRVWRDLAARFSLEHRIVNDTTTLVVLGSPADAARFGVPAAGREVLAVGKFGVERRPALGAPLPQEGAAPPRAHAVLASPRLPYAWGPEWDAAPPAATDPGKPPRRVPARRPPPSRPSREASETASASAEAATPRDKDAGLRIGPRRTPEDAYEGNFLAVMNLLGGWDDKTNALGVAQRWHQARPADVTALLALGEALEANGRPEVAARAYGSLIDLYPGRADMRRLAAARLDRLGDLAGWLAVDAYGRALEQRSDDATSHRLYAFALLRAGYVDDAWAALIDGLAWARVSSNARALERILREDLGLVAAAWIRRWPDQRDFVLELLRVHEVALAEEPSLRFVLSWDNDQSDVDLHVRDGRGWHAFYRHKTLASGGRLLDDIDAGQGLEAFVIDGVAEAYPYRVEVGYYGRGPGLGTGKVEIVEHDGEGNLFFDERPFVVQKQRGYVDLGTLAAPPSRGRDRG